MSFQFGDGFDCYPNGAYADAANGYWDATFATWVPTNSTTRFGVGAALSSSSTGVYLTKSSGQNDALHHLIVAYRQGQAISGTSLGFYLQLLDGTTAQCSVVFRSDGAILLTAGAANGTVLATYTGAFPVTTTWYAFEIEVFISNTAGYMNVRKNGNPVNDFTSATNLDTQASANAYANKLTLGSQVSVSFVVDDLYWRSDASSVPWAGDLRCYTRMPASDAAVQFSRSTGASNFSCVDEPQQNAATDYVFSSTPGHADLYGIAPIASTPLTTYAVTTRAYAIKSDAGTRTMAVQLKSGASTVASPTVVLTTSNWQWAWRHDTTDPATGAAWTAAAVNLVQCGPLVVA